jgi:phosphomethylpyrimidine synthase
MCGHDWCSVRISKEIVEFASGKDEEYFWDRAKVTNALTAEQREILEKRGVLSPEEIHKLASKTKKAMHADAAKGSCHSDYVNADNARELQTKTLPLVTLDVSSTPQSP